MPTRGFAIWVAARSVALLPLVGCSAPSALEVEIPVPVGSQSAIVVVDGLDEAGQCRKNEWAQLAALGPEAPPPLPAIEVEEDARLRVSAIFSPLEATTIGLAVGPLALRSERSDCWWPQDRNLFQAFAEGGTTSPFQEVLAPTPNDEPCVCLEGPPSGCFEYRVSVDRFGTGGPNFMFALDDHRLVASSGTYRVFTYDTRTRTAEEWTLPPGFAAGAYLALDDGEFWFGGEGGALWRGRIDPTLDVRPVSTSSLGGELGWIVGPSDGSEIYTLAYQGALEHYANGVWTVLHRFADSRNLSCGGLLRLSDGEVLVVRGTVGDVLSIRGQTLRWTRISEQDGLCSVTNVPGVGILITTTDGRILRRTSADDWEELGPSGLTQGIFHVAPFADGFVFAGQRGFFGQWRKGPGFCQTKEEVRPIAPGDAYFVVPLGGEVFLFGNGLDAEETKALTRLTP